MRRQLRFIQHPDDESEFVSEILRDSSIQLIDGPRWKTEIPKTHRAIAEIQGNYCIIWSSLDRPALGARYIQACDDWYCDAEMVTIQFSRSQCIDSVITEGRVAIGTNDAARIEAKGVEARFRFLSKFIKMKYLNAMVCWYNPDCPIAPATSGRSANHSAPDLCVWVGPHALHWLREERSRRIRQFRNAGAYAHLLDDMPILTKSPIDA